MPRIYWKSILAVFVLAIGLRLSLQRWQPSTGDSASVAQSYLEEDLVEEESPGAEVGTDAEVDDIEGETLPPGPFTFEKEPIEIKPRPEDEEVSVDFSFVNTSGRPVMVTKIDSNCSCLEASMDQRTYAVGAQGVGKANFKVTSFVGRHEKTIHIYTDDPIAPEQVVTFIMDVPIVVEIEPNLLEWTLGEEPSQKKMAIRMTGEKPMRITKITPTRESVAYELKEVSPGREYHLLVTPKSTAEVSIGAFKLETDSSIPKYARQMAFFNIVKPELAEKKKAAKAKQELIEK